jgi:hypothetical protein
MAGERFTLIVQTKGGPAAAPEGRTTLKVEKPKIFHIAKYPPPIGSRVKVWFDTKERQLIVEDETGRVTYDIYGMPLADVVFEIEMTPRGAVRCVARGNIIALANTREEIEARRAIIHEARNSMDIAAPVSNGHSPERAWHSSRLHAAASRHRTPSIPCRNRRALRADP